MTEMNLLMLDHSLILILVTVGLFTAACFAQWQPDPQLVEERTQRGEGQFNYDEASVPEYELPDVLARPAGGRIRSSDAWPAQREHLLELFREHVFGRRPAEPEQLEFHLIEEDPEAMDGAATLRRIEIRSAHEGRTHAFELILFLPNARREPASVFLLITNRGREHIDPTRAQRSPFWPAEEVIQRGHGIAAVHVSQLAPDDPETFRSQVIQLFEGEGEGEQRPGDACGALAAWGWGASRAMDYLERDGDVDAARVAVVGHSRGGKAALWAGAEDPRFALVVSNNSGCTGAALSRRRYGETLARINNRFPHWFCENYNRFNDNEDALPVDQHMLIALQAPRAVYVASASDDLWADPRGEYLGLAHASPAYELFGHAPIPADPMPGIEQPVQHGPRGHHIREGGHNLTDYDWHRFIDLAQNVWP